MGGFRLKSHLMHLETWLLYHFELFGVSQVTGPFDGAEIGVYHGSHCPWPAVTKHSLRTQA